MAKNGVLANWNVDVLHKGTNRSQESLFQDASEHIGSAKISNVVFETTEYTPVHPPKASWYMALRKDW